MLDAVVTKDVNGALLDFTYEAMDWHVSTATEVHTWRAMYDAISWPTGEIIASVTDEAMTQALSKAIQDA